MTTTRPPDRRTDIRRSQDQLDTSAYDKAVQAEARMEGHEDLCSERFKNIRDDISEVKAELKSQSERQETRHQANTDNLGKINAAIANLAKNMASNEAHRDGIRWFGMTVKDWLLVIFAGGSLLFAAWKNH